MNAFQKRPLYDSVPKTIQMLKAPHKSWFKRHIFLTFLALIFGFFTLKGIVGAISHGNLFSVKEVLISAVGKDVNTDAYNHTNILLVGIGGEGH